MSECEHCGTEYTLDDECEDDGLCHTCAHAAFVAHWATCPNAEQHRRPLSEIAERDEARESLGVLEVDLDQLATAVEALEWYANNGELSPDIGLKARKALAAIRGKEEKT